jgi:hypothetical protein
MSDRIFVFSSNLAGHHRAGAALFARQQRGANYGQGTGLQGQSYAIPTKDRRLKPLPLDAIRMHVETFLKFARAHMIMRFQVTPIGTGYAGYRHIDIAPMFSGAPRNCDLPEEWKEFFEW